MTDKSQEPVVTQEDEDRLQMLPFRLRDGWRDTLLDAFARHRIAALSRQEASGEVLPGQIPPFLSVPNFDDRTETRACINGCLFIRADHAGGYREEASGEVRAAVIEECAKLVENWNGETRDGDTCHIAEALRALSAEPLADAGDVERELRAKLRNIISHASGGHLHEESDVDRGLNDICVEISRHHNRIWEAALEKGAASASTAPDELLAGEFRCHNCKRIVSGVVAPDRCSACHCRDFSAVPPADELRAEGDVVDRAQRAFTALDASLRLEATGRGNFAEAEGAQGLASQLVPLLSDIAAALARPDRMAEMEGLRAEDK